MLRIIKKFLAVYERSSAVFETGAICNHEFITVEDYKAQIFAWNCKNLCKTYNK